MSDNPFIEEDWEREFLKDEMYNYERCHSVIEEWREWEHLHNIQINVIVEQQPIKIITDEYGI